MLQETVDERFGVEVTEIELVSIRCAVAKGHLVVLQLDQSAVADGNAENIGARYFRVVRPSPTGLQCTTQSCLQTFDSIRANRAVLTKACRSVLRKILESAFTGSRKSWGAGSQV